MDLLQEDGEHIHAYEIKSGKTFHPEWNTNLKYLKGLMPKRVTCTQVLYDGAYEDFSTCEGLLNFRKFFQKNRYNEPHTEDDLKAGRVYKAESAEEKPIIQKN